MYSCYVCKGTRVSNPYLVCDCSVKSDRKEFGLSQVSDIEETREQHYTLAIPAALQALRSKEEQAVFDALKKKKKLPADLPGFIPVHEQERDGIPKKPRGYKWRHQIDDIEAWGVGNFRKVYYLHGLTRNYTKEEKE